MSSRLRRAAALLAALAATLLLGSCGGSSEDPELPKIASIRVNDHGPIFRSLSLTLSEPADVEIEYGSAGGPRLVVRSAPASTDHEIVLPQLRASSTYDFAVRAVPGGWLNRPLTTGTFETAALPDDLAAIEFAASGTPSTPLTFLSVRSVFTGGVIVDSDGHVVWYGRTSVAPQGAARRADGSWAIVEDGLAVFSPLGERTAWLPQTRMPSGAFIHHGVTPTPHNTWLALAFDPRTFGAQSLAGEAIWEWDPEADTLEKRWSAFDFFDPTVDFGARSIPSDWFHANSIAFGPRGNLLLSFHFLDQVISVSPDYGAIEWRLGGPGSTFAVAPDQVTSGQHSAREVAPDRVLIFDNGFDRADDARYSRGIEFALDRANGTVATAWEYRPTPDIWASIISSARRLGNGNTVLTFGTPAGLVGATGPIAVHEVSPSGERVWELVVTLPSGSVFQGDPLEAVAGERRVP